MHYIMSHFVTMTTYALHHSTKYKATYVPDDYSYVDMVVQNDVQLHVLHKMF